MKMNTYKFCPQCGKPLKTYVSHAYNVLGTTVLYATCFACDAQIEKIGCVVDNKNPKLLITTRED